MLPPSVFLSIAGVLCLITAALLLRTLGARFRLARLLSAAREVSLDECRELAGGPPVYVRVSGRISSTEEFPDENERPLVFRRTRLDLEVAPDRWRTVLDDREAVPFAVESRSAFVAIDEDALGHGLVAIPRVATGLASELHGEQAEAAAASGASPQTPVRLTIEQLSAVEHVSACGTPQLRDGQPVLTAGLGRPLIVTALDRPAAMRLLASGARRRVAAAAVLIAVGLALWALALGVAVLATAAPVLAASPSPLTSPEPSPVIGVPTDPRAGGGAPLVGAPGLALLVVLGAGLLVAVATLAYVRLTARRGGATRR